MEFPCSTTKFLEVFMKKIIFPGLFLAQIVTAQTTLNPDISIIGDLLSTIDDSSASFSTSGLEIAIQGYVNPFARADVYLHKHDDEAPIEIEEGYITIERGLPFGMGLKAGKFRPDFGKINKEHAHTYAYIHASKVVQETLGEEMRSGVGPEVNFLLPLPWYVNLSAGYFQSGISSHHYHEEEITSDEEEAAGRALSARLSGFYDLSPVTHVEMGFSYYSETAESQNSIIGADFKFKWRPDTYRSFSLQGEYFQNSIPEEEVINAGYIWGNYQFNRIWNAGAIFDYSSDMEEMEYHSFGFFFGFSPVEESSVFRVRLHREIHGDGEPYFSVVTQIIWSLGPHKPHRF